MRTLKNKTNETNFEVIKNEECLETIEPKSLPRMMSIKEMVAVTGLPYTFLRGLCVQNKIVYIKTGKKYLINYDRFIDYLNNGERA